MTKFSDEVIQKVWEKGIAVPYYDSSVWRQDQCGAWIGRDNYGDRSSEYGWEIDHILPISKGGDDKLSNLRPLHWKNNLARQNERLECKVTSSGDSNTEK